MGNPNIRLFYGLNQLECMRELQHWKSAFVAKYGDFDVENMDGKEIGADRIIQCCDTHPFMGKKRLVIVRDFLPEVTKKAVSDQQEDEEAEGVNYDVLLTYLENFPDTCVLVFVSAKPDKRTKLFKKLSEIAQVHEFKEAKGVFFARWVIQEAKRLGGVLEPRVAEYFSMHTGEDMWKAATELEKLVLHTDKPITIEDIDYVVSSSAQVKIFAFVDALGYQDTARAIKYFHQLIDSGENVFMVFNMIVRQFRLLLQIRALMDNNVERKVMMSRLRLAPFQVSTLVKQAERFDLQSLKITYRELLQIDIGIKTGIISASGDKQDMFMLILERFFVENTV